MIEKSLPNNHYCDAYQFSFSGIQKIDTYDLIRYFILCFPWWMKVMLITRELFARIVGLKVANLKAIKKEIRDFKGEVGTGIALFRVIENNNENEILLGLDDKHLNFRLSVLNTFKEKHHIITYTTKVEIHNRMGKVYSSFVLPVHKLIMRSVLAKVADKVSRNGNI